MITCLIKKNFGPCFMCVAGPFTFLSTLTKALRMQRFIRTYNELFLKYFIQIQ